MLHLQLLSATATSRSVITCSKQTQQNDAQGSRRPRKPFQRQKNSTDRPFTSTATASALSSASLPVENQDNDLPIANRALQVLSRYRALVLDSAYRPIDVVNWQRAICMDLLEKADVLEYYNTTISSVSEQFFLPAVMRARWYGGSSGRFGRVPLNRRHLFIRDNFQCQYCSKRSDLTLDHIIPQSKGGRNTWQNLVTACAPCNVKKGDKTLKQMRWKLAREPKEPSPWELNSVLSMIGASGGDIPSEWQNYLFGDTASLSSEEE